MKLILRKISLENFKIHKNTTIEFSDGINIFQGVNGSGKSSILEGIFAALYLGTREGGFQRRYSDLISYGAPYAKIELEFDVIDRKIKHHCTIKRVIETNGTSKVELRVIKELPDGTKKAEPLITKVSDAIERIKELLGMDAKEFISTVYVRQKDITNILDKDVLTQVFNKYLGLEKYDVALQNFSRILSQIEYSISSINNNILSKDSELRDKRKELEKLKQEKEVKIKIKNEREKDKEFLESNIKTLEKLENITMKILQILREIRHHSELIKDYEEKVKLLADYETQKIEELHKLASSKITKYQELKAEESSLRRGISQVNGYIEDLKSQLASFIEKQKEVEKYENIIKEVKSSLANFPIDVPEDLSQLSQTISNFEALKRSYVNISVVFNHIKNLLAEEYKVTDLSNFVSKYESVLENITNAVEAINKDILRLKENLGAISGEINSKRKHVKILEEGVREGLAKCPVCGREFNSIEEAMNVIREYNNEIEELQNKIEEINAKIAKLNKEFLKRRKLKEDLLRIKNDVTKLKDSPLKNFDSINEIVTLLRRLHGALSNMAKAQPYKDLIPNINKKIENEQKKLQDLKVRLQEVLRQKSSMDMFAANYGYNNIEEFCKDLQEKYAIYKQTKTEVIAKKNDYEKRKRELKDLEKQLETQFSALKGELPLVARVLGIEPTKIHLNEREVELLHEQIRSKKEHLQTQLKELENELLSIRDDIVSAETLIKAIEKDVQKLKREIEQLKEDKEVLEELRRKFKKEILEKIREARGRILQEVAAKVSIIATDYFERFLHNKSYIVRLKTEAPSGRQEQTVRISPIVVKHVRGVPKETSADSISGGEEVALAISLRLAISKFLGYSVGVLIMDEPTVHLDYENVEKLKDLIRGLREAIHTSGFQVILVTHHDVLTQIENARIFRFEIVPESSGGQYSRVTVEV